MTTSFVDLGVPHDLARRLHAAGVTAPFPVQELTLADTLAGRDLCGRAPTGSGKTLAFAIPLAVRTPKAEPGRPRALVLVPTRELAAQVAETLLPLAQLRQRRVATVYGGTAIGRDLQRLRRGVDILVATPGRLADLVKRGACDLRDVGMVVLDEADRMADMGFLPEVRRLLDATSPDRQTLLFSATLDKDVDELVRRYQRQPVHREVDADPGARADVRHLFWLAERDERRKLTGDIVRRVSPAIVFTRTKHGADRLARQLEADGISAAAIHGNRTQGQRERALARFGAGEVSTLVATDVAARGIHIDDVGVVVHYDLAGSDKDYVHRSGRTGRAGATGLVVSLVDASQRKESTGIQRSLDLPQGLHPLDLGLLQGGELPAPVASPAVSGPGGRAGAGPRSGPTRRTGSEPTPAVARTRAPRRRGRSGTSTAVGADASSRADASPRAGTSEPSRRGGQRSGGGSQPSRRGGQRSGGGTGALTSRRGSTPQPSRGSAQPSRGAGGSRYR